MFDDVTLYGDKAPYHEQASVFKTFEAWLVYLRPKRERLLAEQV
jgi:hypothetical protein